VAAGCAERTDSSRFNGHLTPAGVDVALHVTHDDLIGWWVLGLGLACGSVWAGKKRCACGLYVILSGMDYLEREEISRGGRGGGFYTGRIARDFVCS
jgi:hypothetical protein